MVNVTLLGQIISRVNRYSFKKIVDKYQSDKHHTGINSWMQLTALLNQLDHAVWKRDNVED